MTSNAGSEEVAAATGAREPVPGVSPGMLTGNQSGGQFVLCVERSERKAGVESGGRHRLDPR